MFSGYQYFDENDRYSINFYERLAYMLYLSLNLFISYAMVSGDLNAYYYSVRLTQLTSS